MMQPQKLGKLTLAAILIWLAVATILTGGWTAPLDSHARAGAPAGAFPLIALLLAWIDGRLLPDMRFGFPRAGVVALDRCVIGYVLAVLGLYYFGPHGATKAVAFAIACTGVAILIGGIFVQALDRRRAALAGADHVEHREA